jgi:hypothetical protein
MVVSRYLIFTKKNLFPLGKGFFCEVQFQRISITKTAHYLSVYKAVLTVFMLYDYDKNIDNMCRGILFLLFYAKNASLFLIFQTLLIQFGAKWTS